EPFHSYGPVILLPQPLQFDARHGGGTLSPPSVIDFNVGPLRPFISRPGTIAKASFPPVPAETRRHLTPFHLHPNWAMACPPPNRPRRTSPPHPRDGSPSRNLWTSTPGRFASPADARASRRHLGVSLVSTTSRPPRFTSEPPASSAPGPQGSTRGRTPANSFQ